MTVLIVAAAACLYVVAGRYCYLWFQRAWLRFARMETPYLYSEEGDRGTWESNRSFCIVLAVVWPAGVLGGLMSTMSRHLVSTLRSGLS